MQESADLAVVCVMKVKYGALCNRVTLGSLPEMLDGVLHANLGGGLEECKYYVVPNPAEAVRAVNSCAAPYVDYAVSVLGEGREEPPSKEGAVIIPLFPEH